MTALEFAVTHTFKCFFFGLWLTILWLIVLAPLAVLAYYLGFRKGLPDIKALPPLAMATFVVLGLAALLATVSIAVNWHRYVLLKEKPRRLGWVRLNGVVWRYLFAFLFIIIVVAVVAGAVFAVITYAVPAIELQLGQAAKPAAIALALLLGLFGLFTWYRLSSWLPAVATGDKDYGLGTAWKTTRNNRLAFLGFTFWLLFSLAIPGAVGAGAYFGQQVLNNPYATMAAFALIGLLGWLTLFLVTTIATSHYALFSGKYRPEE